MKRPPPKRIAVATGTRAEYGLLLPLLRLLDEADDMELSLVVTGAHLARDLGHTVDQIVADGFTIAARVDMLLSADSNVAVTKSLGLGTVGFADVLDRLAPDLLVMLGDRYEMLAVAQAALIARIPVAHLCGGDVTEGAFDESIRHAISKMAHLHFPTNEAARRRLLQMGEDPKRVFNVGFTGLDHLRGELLGREALAASLGRPLETRNLLVTYHPETLGRRPAKEDFAELLAALDPFDGGIFFTYPNADTHGRSLIPALEAFVAAHPLASAHRSLGQQRYLSLLRAVDAVVGNSSSGLYEAPSLGTPTVNVGERQKGRLAAASVTTVPCRQEDISAALERALAFDMADVENPYGGPGASAAILTALRAAPPGPDLMRKPFFEASP
ncbi:MAG: UDP-N-acetylglucosamine 2-epimerase [Myxococcota bacterium]